MKFIIAFLCLFSLLAMVIAKDVPTEGKFTILNSVDMKEAVGARNADGKGKEFNSKNYI